MKKVTKRLALLASLALLGMYGGGVSNLVL